MEETLRIVFSVFVSIVILFLFPLYITFEKRDDIAYAMAMKTTHNFVENVRNKGYITSKMYSDFESKLAATGNLYEIKMEHRASKVYPIDGNYKFVEEIYTEKQILPVINKDVDSTGLDTFYDKKEEDYKNIEIKNELNHGYLYMYSIIDLVQNEDDKKLPIYAMNKGDVFNITVKNTNTSIATRIFQIITANNSTNVRVFINYGGVILNEEYDV